MQENLTPNREAVREALHAYEDTLKLALLAPLTQAEVKHITTSLAEVRAAQRVLCMENR